MKYLLPLLLLVFSSCFNSNRFLTPAPSPDPVMMQVADSTTANIQSHESPLIASPDNAAWKIFGLLIFGVFLLCFFSNTQWIKGRLNPLRNYILSKYSRAPKDVPQNVSLGDLQSKK